MTPVVGAGIYEELALLCDFFLLGVVLAGSYDLLRLWRGIVPHNTFWVNVTDLFYWLYVAVVVFVGLNKKNDGRLRGFIFGALLVGMILWYVTVSKNITPRLIMILQKVRNILLSPFVRLAEAIEKKRKEELEKARVGWNCQKKAMKKRLKMVRKIVKISIRKL